MVNTDFLYFMDDFCRNLKVCGCHALITSTFRTTTIIHGAIVKPAKVSNHLVGHGIDCNIYDASGHFWSHKELAEPKDEVLEFIQLMRMMGRWGGDFKTPDTIHFDDGLNLKDPKRWKEIYDEVQK